MPAAAHDDSLIAVDREPVEMIHSVRTGDGVAAAFAVEEVERLPDRALPRVVADAERRCDRVADANRVAPWNIDDGKVGLPEGADRRAHRLKGLTQHDGAGDSVCHPD